MRQSMISSFLRLFYRTFRLLLILPIHLLRERNLPPRIHFSNLGSGMVAVYQRSANRGSQSKPKTFQQPAGA